MKKGGEGVNVKFESGGWISSKLIAATKSLLKENPPNNAEQGKVCWDTGKREIKGGNSCGNHLVERKNILSNHKTLH